MRNRSHGQCILPFHPRHRPVKPGCPDQILPNLYLSAADVSRYMPAMKKCNITHIVNAATKEDGGYFPENFKYKILGCEDTMVQSINQHFDDCNKFIDEARESGSVLVHCLAGASRSATIVIAYLMYSQRLPFEDALAFTQQKRSVVHPNANFVEQLKKYEQHLAL